MPKPIVKVMPGFYRAYGYAIVKHKNEWRAYSDHGKENEDIRHRGKRRIDCERWCERNPRQS